MQTIKLLLLFGFMMVGFIWGGYQLTHAYFVSSVVSNGNVFAAAEVFPSASATPEPSVSPNPSSSPEPTTAPVGIANHVVISEVQIAGAQLSNDFIELYNPTEDEIDLSGWKLRKKTNGGSNSLIFEIGARVIHSHGYYLWANNQNGYEIGADDSDSDTLAADNSIILLKPDNSEVDKVAWGNGTNQYVEGIAFPTNPSANHSLERKALSSSDEMTMIGEDAQKGNGYDTNNNGNDFVLREVSQPQNSGSSTEVP